MSPCLPGGRIPGADMCVDLSCGAAAAARTTAARASGARFASYSLPALPYDVTALEPVRSMRDARLVCVCAAQALHTCSARARAERVHASECTLKHTRAFTLPCPPRCEHLQVVNTEIMTLHHTKHHQT